VLIAFQLEGSKLTQLCLLAERERAIAKLREATQQRQANEKKREQERLQQELKKRQEQERALEEMRRKEEQEGEQLIHEPTKVE
jgi:penicillin-binding protein 1B